MQLDLIVVGSSSAPSECGEPYKAKELTVALDPDAFDMSVLSLSLSFFGIKLGCLLLK